MSILTKKLPSFTGVAPGQTASCRIPSNYSYHTFFVVSENVPAPGSDISEIRLVANGIVIQRFSGKECKRIMAFDKNDTVNVFVINAIRPKLKNRASVESTIIPFGANNDPNPITTLLIEFDIAAGASADVKLTGYALVSPRLDLRGNPAVLKLVRKFIYSPTGAGEFDISDLPRSGAINRIFFSEKAKIDKITVSMDSVEIWNRTRELNDNVIDSSIYRTNLSDYFVIDTTESGDGSDIWSVSNVNDFRIKLFMNDAADIDVLVEYISTLGN